MRSIVSLCGVVMMVLPIGPSLEAQTRSPVLAKQCVAALTEQNLNAFATRQLNISFVLQPIIASK